MEEPEPPMLGCVVCRIQGREVEEPEPHGRLAAPCRVGDGEGDDAGAERAEEERDCDCDPTAARVKRETSEEAAALRGPRGDRVGQAEAELLRLAEAGHVEEPPAPLLAEDAARRQKPLSLQDDPHRGPAQNAAGRGGNRTEGSRKIARAASELMRRNDGGGALIAAPRGAGGGLRGSSRGVRGLRQSSRGVGGR